MTYPPFHHSCLTGPLDHKVAEIHVFTLPQAGPGTCSVVRACLVSFTSSTIPVGLRFIPCTPTEPQPLSETRDQDSQGQLAQSGLSREVAGS